jgi:hypothetical protein
MQIPKSFPKNTVPAQQKTKKAIKVIFGTSEEQKCDSDYGEKFDKQEKGETDHCFLRFLNMPSHYS